MMKSTATFYVVVPFHDEERGKKKKEKKKGGNVLRACHPLDESDDTRPTCCGKFFHSP